jgi:putative two-component system hydrogenase maturation factor HypX/HoxX
VNELARTIITTDSHLTIAALQGNAGAGGAFLALAADRVYARRGVILNPHYMGMGNLYGSEYWTYLLPRRVGEAAARTLTENRLPIDTDAAKQLGFIDEHFAGDPLAFRRKMVDIAEQSANHRLFPQWLAAKNRRRQADERRKPLEAYRAEEMERMKLNFYGFDPSYHVARYNFVHKVPHSWTPLHLALHRRLDWPGKPPAASSAC